MHWKVQQRFGFVKIEGSLKYAILAVDRDRGHGYLTEIDSFSFRSYRKTRSNLHICFAHIINHLSTFLNFDTVSKNLQLRSYFGSLNVPQSVVQNSVEFKVISTHLTPLVYDLFEQK